MKLLSSWALVFSNWVEKLFLQSLGSSRGFYRESTGATTSLNREKELSQATSVKASAGAVADLLHLQLH